MSKFLCLKSIIERRNNPIPQQIESQVLTGGEKLIRGKGYRITK